MHNMFWPQSHASHIRINEFIVSLSFTEHSVPFQLNWARRCIKANWRWLIEIFAQWIEVIMLKFIRSKGNQQPTAERQKLQKELYAFRKVSQACHTQCCNRSKQKTDNDIRKVLYTFALQIVSLLYLYETFLISKITPKEVSFPPIKRTTRGVPAGL